MPTPHPNTCVRPFADGVPAGPARRFGRLAAPGRAVLPGLVRRRGRREWAKAALIVRRVPRTGLPGPPPTSPARHNCQLPACSRRSLIRAALPRSSLR
jgi:hypothetical protein